MLGESCASVELQGYISIIHRSDNCTPTYQLYSYTPTYQLYEVGRAKASPAFLLKEMFILITIKQPEDILMMGNSTN